MSNLSGDIVDTITLTPQYGFFAVTVEIEEEDSETGKTKKIKEEHLVDGRNVTDVESKVAKEMDGIVSPWKIVKCQTSKIISVY